MGQIILIIQGCRSNYFVNYISLAMLRVASDITILDITSFFAPGGVTVTYSSLACALAYPIIAH